MREIKKRLEQARAYVLALGKWLAAAGVIGGLSGLVGSAFHIGVERVTQYRLGHPWVLYTLPVAALAAVGLYRLLKTEGQSTNDVLAEIQSGRGLSPRLLPAIFGATLITHLSGGSAGREGAALQMGGVIGFWVGRALRLDDSDRRTATMIGMAAFFAALFGTPLAATVFAMGVVSVGLMYHAAFLPCLAASLCAYGVSRCLGVQPTRFDAAIPALAGNMLLRVAGLSALCAWVSVLFCGVIHQTERLLARLLKNPWLRALCGGALLLGLTKLLGTTAYNGAGMEAIAAAVEEGAARPWDFLLKTLFTAVTLAVGFKGGEVVPSFFVGAAFGCVAGPLLGIPAGFAASLGMVAVFCGAVNCPLASVLLAAELFGGEGLLYYALACGVSFVLSGYSSLYSSQRIVFDKLKARRLDRAA